MFSGVASRPARGRRSYSVVYIDSSGNIIGGNDAGSGPQLGQFNVYLGHQTGKSSLSSLNFGNTVVGAFGATSLTNGTQCTLLGFQAGTAVTGDTGHTCVGYQAGMSLNSNSQTWNTFVGHVAGRLVTTGGSMVALGRAAMATETDGAYNVAVGHGSLFQAIHNQGVIGLGDSAGGANTDGTSTNWQGSGLTYWGTINDTNVAYLGRYTGKSSASARSNATMVGTLARAPLRDNVMVLGHGLAAVETAGRVWDGWTRVDTTSTTGINPVTSANLFAGLNVRAGTLTGNVNDITDTAANLISQGAGPGNNSEVPTSIEFNYANNTSGGFSVTLVGGTGVSISGLGLGGTIASGALARFRIVFTSSAPGSEAAAIYRVG